MSLVDSSVIFRIAGLAFGLGYQRVGVALLEHLLKHLPSHVAARCLLGEELLVRERWAEAEEHFRSVLEVDPTNLSGLRGMGRVDLATGVTAMESEHLRWAWELCPWDATTRELLNTTLDDVSPLGLARILTVSSLHEEALPYYEVAFHDASDRPSEKSIAALLLSEALWRTKQTKKARSLVETLIKQQPLWIRPKLILVDIALDAREDALGVALLHDASALDSSFLVAQALCGQDRCHKSFPLHSLEIPVPGPELTDGAPRVLRYLLKADPLPEPFTAGKVSVEASSLSTHPDEVTRKGSDASGIVQLPSDAVYPMPATQQLGDESAVADPDQEVPVRLILSGRDRLVAKYGDYGYRDLDAKLQELCDATAGSTGHKIIKIYVDDEACLSAYNLNSVDPSDPQQIRRLIQQLQTRLRTRSEKLNSLLIIGGDSIIPFHRLPNPTDDEDEEILSDWPYAARDGDSLLAQFSVGRIPDDQSADLEILSQLVDNAIRHHTASYEDVTRATSSSRLRRVLRVFGSRQEAVTSVGYSAEIWAEASRSVFQVIGDTKSLKLSPPLTDYDFLSTYEEMPTLGYFNLHGFRGSPYWYGHGESEHGAPLLPVALTPISISWTNAETALIYTEACYGADLENEHTDGSIALNFLRSSALGFIGSTAMAYGSLAPPLSGADLLGRYVWEGILSGLPIGCALRRARSAFIRDAAEGQGYLDGEDQKTLLSFVLYGDPAISLESRRTSQEPDEELEVSRPPTACHWRMLDSGSVPVSPDLREKVRRSLPFLEVSGLKVYPLVLCNGGCSSTQCAMHPCGAVSTEVDSVSELIVTSQQDAISKGGNHLHHVVKVTVNAEGDVTKVLMSRGGICTGKRSRRK